LAGQGDRQREAHGGEKFFQSLGEQTYRKWVFSGA
jgi:hypothetical protein